MANQTMLRKYYDRLKERYTTATESTWGKVALSPIIFVVKVFSVIMGGLGLLYGVLYLLRSSGMIMTEEDVDYLKDDGEGNFVVNKEIEKMKREINLIENENHKNNYRDLTEEEILSYNSYMDDPDMKKATFERKKFILKTMKKIEAVRKPSDSIDDMNDLYKEESKEEENS